MDHLLTIAGEMFSWKFIVSKVNEAIEVAAAPSADTVRTRKQKIKNIFPSGIIPRNLKIIKKHYSPTCFINLYK